MFSTSSTAKEAAPKLASFGLEREALSTYGIMPIYNGPAMVATSPKLANFGAASFAVLEVENIGYTE